MQKTSEREWIIGVSYGHHESSCTALSNFGDIIFLREEWLTRVKLDFRFPKSSINYLIQNYIKNENVKTVAHFQKPLINWLSIGTSKNLSPENYLLKIRQFKNSDLFLAKEIRKLIKQKYNLVYCPHHLSHALSSAQFSKNKNVIYLVLDGYGDGLSGAIFDKNFNTIKEFQPNQSLGLVYSAITEWAGFVPNEDEYKVMAIAAFGKPKFEKFIGENIIRFDKDTIYINEDYFNFKDVSKSALLPKFFKDFGPKRTKSDDLLKNKNVCDVISSFQYCIEHVVLKLIQTLTKQKKDIQIICSGGLFHNSVLVGKLNTYLKNEILVPPCPGDPGSSIGAAFFGAIFNNWNNSNKSTTKCLDSFIGPKVEDISIYPKLFKQITSNLNDSFELSKKLLKKDDIFAVYDGIMEIGPRALGSRSLICDALSKKAVKKLNEIIKKRESFRPLAIMLNQKNFKKIFGNNKNTISNLYWMAQVNWTNDKNKLPFLHHDNSSRPQLVNTSKASKIPDILKMLIDKNYILSNTSFNIAGDPMVFSVEDVYANMIRMNIKYLYHNKCFYEAVDENYF